MDPTLRQLEYAVALADTGNFRRAAESCHVTQPALSTQIRQMEDGFGVELFERDRRGVRPTAAGSELVVRARGVLRDVADLVEATRGSGDALAGDLRLGVIPTIAPYLLPRSLPRVRKRWPDLRLLLVEDETEVLVRRLERGELDLLLLALDVDVGRAETMHLFDDPFLLAVPAGHALARRKRVKLDDLDSEEVLLLADGHWLRDQALGLCRRARAAEFADLSASSLNTLVRMVASGIGVTLLPEMAVADEVTRGDRLTVLPFTRPAPARRIGLAWRPTSPRKAGFRALAGAFRE